MATIIVQPDGIEFEARTGAAIMSEAQVSGLYWPTTCGGQGVCTTCLSEVVSGAELLTEMGRSERKTLIAERGESILAKPLRLACQACVNGEGKIVLYKAGVHGGGI